MRARYKQLCVPRVLGTNRRVIRSLFISFWRHGWTVLSGMSRMSAAASTSPGKNSVMNNESTNEGFRAVFFHSLDRAPILGD